MAFVLRGDYRGVPATATWLEPGRIDSRPSALGMAALDLVREGALVRDHSAGSELPADLMDARAAFVTLRAVFDRPERVEAEGDAPGGPGSRSTSPA